MTPRPSIAGAVLATLAVPAFAQTPPVASPRWLDRMAADRNQERGPHTPLPPTRPDAPRGTAAQPWPLEVPGCRPMAAGAGVAEP
jgi:hypothetical protein